MEPKRYIARNGELYCPHCGGCIKVDLIDGGCPLCGCPINNKVPPVGRNCDNMDCFLCDYYNGCQAPELCDKQFLL